MTPEKKNKRGTNEKERGDKPGENSQNQRNVLLRTGVKQTKG